MSVVPKRVRRQERREQTRADLIAAARAVFLRQGFHAATLDRIAEEAGYTKGAVYSNFARKDDLLVAVFDEHFSGRVREYEPLVLAAESIEDAYRAVARYWHDANEREPEWSRLVVEFLAHASRDERLREAVKAARGRSLDRIAELVDQLAERHGVEYTLATREIVRGSGALNRGLAVEQLLDPELSVEAFEEMHLAYMRGLTKPSTRRQERR
jgi:AcrR family transcriptional regulator